MSRRCMLQCRAVLEVVLKPASGLSGPKERLVEQQLVSCCESVVLTQLHPHTALSVTLQVENDAGAVSKGPQLKPGSVYISTI